LNAILGYSSLLQGQIEAGIAAGQEGLKLGDDVQRIRDAGQNLLGLIDDLFILSGQDSARSASRGAPIDIGALIGEVAEEYRAGGQHRAQIILDPALMTGEIMLGDRGLVQRCLRHLLDHAALHAAQNSGGGVVTMAAHPVTGDEAAIRITLADNGPAPSSALLDALRKTVSDGEFMADHAIPGGTPAGVVGLAMAHGLAASVQGHITISSAPDGGLIRILDLPLQADSSGKNAMTDTPTEPSNNVTDILSARRAAHSHQAHQKVALIIDDDPSAVDLLARWMRRCGYHVLSANNGAAGFEIALRENPDLVLLDALMPGHSGYELLPQMRQAPQLAATPIVLVTVDDDRERGLQAGASDFVRKPISEAELRHIISVYDSELCGDILVIEDDDDAAEIMCRNLARLGFTPRRAVDGAEGLEMLSASRPAAIVLDLNMPRLNGFEFIEALGLDCDVVPVVVVSGQDLSLVEHRKLMAAGCRFFLKGASAPREIAQTLREVVA
jgi:CheY-like chemotaxis protein